MSGLEVAGVIVGVLPLLIEVVQSYSTVSNTLYTFRHYSKEVKKIQIQFRVHHGIFLNECRLLLRLVADERSAKDMLEDEKDKRWMDKELNDKMKGILWDNYDLCRDIMEASKEIINTLSEELEQFDVLIVKKNQDEPLKDAIRRLRKAVKVCFDKSKYEKSLIALRDRNEELNVLRSQIGALQQHKACPERNCPSPQTLPTHVTAIQTASRKLHEALSGAWCCGDVRHGVHFAKVRLDSEVQREVRLDLAISCQRLPHHESRDCLTEPPIWLYVQSINIDAVPCQSATKVAVTPKRPLSPVHSKSIEAPSLGSRTKPSLDVDRLVPCKKRRKKFVRFADGNLTDGKTLFAERIGKDTSTILSGMVVQQANAGINLCQTKNICYYLMHNGQMCSKTVESHCVGYLETPQMYKHMFYLQKRQPAPKPHLNGAEQISISSLLDLMGDRLDETLTIVDQLKLAHKTALSILKFYDTPWLANRWRLKDMSYFGSPDSFNEESLKTLHLSSRICSPITSDTGVMEGVEGAVQSFSEEDYFGINNTTLFFLGVALLELGHWKSIESLRSQRDPNEILTARRVASRPTPLGPKYQEIARKCLQCNFGFGTDLKKKELQTAVYNDVVSELDKMVKTLSVSD